jgi:ATP-dependent Clp protease ATP-binding subunit ClpB
MARRDVPASLMGRLFSLDMGEYEERVKAVLNGKPRHQRPRWSLANDTTEVEKASKDGVGVILFIHKLHLIMAGKGSEGGGMDAANLLKSQLARGKLRVIGATTLAEYSKYFEKDAAFERGFAQVIVNEPNVTDTSKSVILMDSPRD